MESNFPTIRFGDVLTPEGTRNGIYKGKEFHGRGQKIINMGELFGNPRLFDIPMKRVELDAKEQKKFLVQPGDLLFARRSLVAEGAGKCCLIKEVGDETCFESSIIKATPRQDVADSEYIFYLFTSQIGRHLLGTILRQTAVSGITGTDLVELEIPLPALPEQKAIAHILGTIDDKIELNRKTSETLEGIAKALFKSWFVDFDPVRAKAEGRSTGLPDEISELFPDSLEESELGEIPSGWFVQRLEDLLELSYGKALKESDRIPGLFPVFGSNGEVGFHNEALVKGPGIIVGRKGNPGIVKWSEKDFFPIDTTFYVKPKMKDLRLSFLFHVLSNQRLPELSADSAVPGLNRNIAYMNQQVLPPVDLIFFFDQMVSTIFDRMNCLRSEEEILSPLRNALLPRLISGELRVPDAEKMLEEVGI